MQRNTKLRSSLLLCVLHVTRWPCTSSWSGGRGGWEPRGAEREPLSITFVPPSFCRSHGDIENSDASAKKAHIQGLFSCCGLKPENTHIGLLLFVLWWCHDFQILVRAEHCKHIRNPVKPKPWPLTLKSSSGKKDVEGWGEKHRHEEKEWLRQDQAASQ